MLRLSTSIILAVLMLCFTGCSAKPENVVKEYMKRPCVYDEE